MYKTERRRDSKWNNDIYESEGSDSNSCIETNLQHDSQVAFKQFWVKQLFNVMKQTF